MVVALACAVLGFSLMQTLLVPALPQIAGAFEVNAGVGGWILTSYLLAGAVSAPILGSLGDLFGYRRLLLLSLLVFSAGGVLAVIAPNLPVLLIARVLQGASTATFPLALALVRRHLAPAPQASAIGWLSAMLGVGAGSALVIGGLLTDVLGWRWLFGVGAVLGVLSALLVIRWVPSSRRGTPARLDLLGAGLLALALLALLLAISQGSAWGWVSAPVLSLWGVAGTSAAALVLVELRVANPVVDVRALAHPGLLLTHLVTLFLGFVPYLFYVGLPVLFESGGGIGHGMSVTAAGVAMLPSAVLVFFGGRFTPRLLRSGSGGAVAATALLLMCVGSLVAGARPESLGLVVLGFAIVGLGNGIGFAVAADLVTRIAPRSEIAAAAGLNGVLRTIGSAIGIPVTGLLLAGAGEGDAIAVAPVRTLFLVAAALSLLAAGLGACIRVPRTERREPGADAG